MPLTLPRGPLFLFRQVYSPMAFLDSADKAGKPSSHSFRYEYTSVVDVKGLDNTDTVEWSLQPTGESLSFPFDEKDAAKLRTDVGIARSLFQKPITVMYNRPYTITFWTELRLITSFADYYCALPILSATLNGALIGSPLFHLDDDGTGGTRSEFGNNAHQIILIALKLRYKHAELTRLVTEEYDRNCRTQSPLCSMFSGILVAGEIKYGKEMSPYRPPARSPNFFRKLLSPGFAKSEPSELKTSLKAVMVNNLVLDKSGCGAGEGPYLTYLLCANIKDEDLPWDRDEVDW
ncbi:uncharacterized protein PAC_13309 [Phialocephala subalpina]|uniref:Uncharacterized protein n=1 Tax=Phialocephala subalpina TaxID=576137 RepID=A0A1L7XEF3_9HELO|nr:uncharacterized protein PAC_13309 [Phialocephala subalpina]